MLGNVRRPSFWIKRYNAGDVLNQVRAVQTNDEQYLLCVLLINASWSRRNKSFLYSSDASSWASINVERLETHNFSWSFWFSLRFRSERKKARIFETSENLSILSNLQMCFTREAGNFVSPLTRLKARDSNIVRLYPSLGFPSSSKMISSSTSFSSFCQATSLSVSDVLVRFSSL